MPFVQRVIEPKFLSRTTLFNADGKARITDDELLAVTNNTLANALRQLASLLLVANDIFVDLSKELENVTQRADTIKNKVESLEKGVLSFDPKKVAVPESDICTFSLLKNHYKSKHEFATNLFTISTRSNAVQSLYESSTTPVPIIRQMDRFRRDGHRSSRYFACTPVLGSKRKRIENKVNLEIESRKPAAVEELRKWTSSEALGDITIGPDYSNCIAPIVTNTSNNTGAVSEDRELDHKLPSPEEQVHVVALKFPAEIVAIDITGKYFNRMSIQRRSFLRGNVLNQTDGTDGNVRGQTKQRKHRSRRRNTIAGTDKKEIETAFITGEEPAITTSSEFVCRSKSSDALRSSSEKKSSSESNRSHFYSLKEWGKDKLRMMNRSQGSVQNKVNNDEEDFNIYEKVNIKRKRSFNLNKDKRISHEAKLPITSFEKSIATVADPTLAPTINAIVKLRECTNQRRRRRAGNIRDDLHSSSGNWSASSESGRVSLDSETIHPKSSTSDTTSINSVNSPNSVNSRRKFNINTFKSNSITSEETITPDIHNCPEDVETSSIYSCDTEGYYTSFHMDSGLKTLKEDAPPTPLHSTTAFSSNTLINAENEYELFGKGSTSTTASSAGTVCTTLQTSPSSRSFICAPEVPERKSSLSTLSSRDGSLANSLKRKVANDKTGTVKRSPANKPNTTPVKHQEPIGNISPDSGRNTSSSPIESNASSNGIRSCSEFEYSESSDMEGVDRIERIRVKTTINSSRIPSMCVITPPPSDDESTKSTKNTRSNNLKEQNVEVYDDSEKDSNRLVYLELLNNNTKRQFEEENSSSVDAIENYEQDIENANVPTAQDISPSDDHITAINEAIKVQSKSVLKNTLLPFNNVLGKIKLKLTDVPKEKNIDQADDDYGDYVTIADVRNNNQKSQDQVDNVVKGNSNEEYVSLNELYCDNLHKEDNSSNMSNSLDRMRKQGARVKLDAEGKVVYSSDSLKRRKGAHSTFEPGPYIKELNTPEINHTLLSRTPITVKTRFSSADKNAFTKNETPSASSAPQLEKFIIRATTDVVSQSAEKVRVPPSTIVTPNVRQPPSNSSNMSGAYVHMQDARGCTSLAQKTDKAHSSLEHPGTNKTFEMHNRTYGDRYLTSNIARNNSLSQENFVSTIPSTESLPFNISSHNFQKFTIPHSTTILPGNTNMVRASNYSEVTDNGREFDSKSLSTRSRQLPQIQRSFSRENTEVPFSNHLLPIMPASHSIYTYNPNLAADKSFSMTNSHFHDSLRISPIDPRTSGEFKSSTPSAKPYQQIKSAVNLTNILSSPKKSLMSTEELHAKIHKGKKKLNVETSDYNNLQSSSFTSNASPEKIVTTPEAGYLNSKTRSRFSWSPSDGEYVDYNTNIDKLSPSPKADLKPSGACSDRKVNSQTARLDFKKLLLKQNIKTSVSPSSKRLSAVEQLKLSKEQVAPVSSGISQLNILELSKSPKSFRNRKFIDNVGDNKQRSLPKIMSPKSQWKFLNPRTDVLSSTILEDCDESKEPNSSSQSSSVLPITQRYDSILFRREGPVKSVRQGPISQHTYSQRTSNLQQYSQNTHIHESRNKANVEPTMASSSPPALETAF